jgi:hypothetical protein
MKRRGLVSREALILWYLRRFYDQRCPESVTAGIKPRPDIEAGEEEPWALTDLRKACATYYDEHVPESSVEILGHSVGRITYRHYAHRAPPAFRAIMTLPQPSAFSATLQGGDSECPCCRRRFADAG